MNRSDFAILDNLIYFDNAATTLKPKCVVEKINNYYNNYPSNIHRGEYNISEVAEGEFNKAREMIASFIGASSNEVIFTSGCTDILDIYYNQVMKC